MVFTPNADLAEETTYTITVTATIADMADNAFAGGSYTFTTQEALTGLASGEGCAPAAGGASLVWAAAAVALLLRPFTRGP